MWWLHGLAMWDMPCLFVLLDIYVLAISCFVDSFGEWEQ